MTDFSTANIHCSSIGNIMGKVKKETNKAKSEKALAKAAEHEEKFNALKDHLKEMKTGLNIKTAIASWKEKAEILANTPDVDELSKGAKSHLKRVYGYLKYGKWCASQDKGTKYTNKGNLAEGDSIKLISLLQGQEYVKNEERVQNEYLTGIPDVFVGESIYKAEYVVDLKTSWDIESYLDNLGKPLSSQYWWQIQGYLALTGAKLGEVSYCLVDTPESIINDEKYKLMKRLNCVTDEDPLFVRKAAELTNNLTFSDIPAKDRRLRFFVERDEDAIQKIYRKVEECRKYLAEIEALHMQGEFLALDPTIYQEESDESEEDS